VADGISLSNAPGKPELVYGHAFFPWTNPVTLTPGDEIQITLQAKLTGDDYVWRWDTKIFDPREAENIKADFKQSTFYSSMLSPAQLVKKTANYVATLNADGEVDRCILEMMDGNTRLMDIASTLQSRFPHLFRDANDALGRVGKLSQEYSQ
jgi:protein arginine N-methyltransferase 1